MKYCPRVSKFLRLTIKYPDGLYYVPYFPISFKEVQIGRSLPPVISRLYCLSKVACEIMMKLFQYFHVSHQMPNSCLGAIF